jgi:hypothetical protein
VSRYDGSERAEKWIADVIHLGRRATEGSKGPLRVDGLFQRIDPRSPFRSDALEDPSSRNHAAFEHLVDDRSRYLVEECGTHLRIVTQQLDHFLLAF